MHTLDHGSLGDMGRGALSHDRHRAHAVDPDLDRLRAAGLVHIDEEGGWKLTRLGEGAMARFYKQVEDSSFWRGVGPC
jgi:DNA-binding transcriptional ArsR family regulator